MVFLGFTSLRFPQRPLWLPMELERSSPTGQLLGTTLTESTFGTCYVVYAPDNHPQPYGLVFSKPWVITYASILGRMKSHVPPFLMFTRGSQSQPTYYGCRFSGVREQRQGLATSNSPSTAPLSLPQESCQGAWRPGAMGRCRPHRVGSKRLRPAASPRCFKALAFGFPDIPFI